jgi:hypothetical protein
MYNIESIVGKIYKGPELETFAYKHLLLVQFFRCKSENYEVKII